MTSTVDLPPTMRAWVRTRRAHYSSSLRLVDIPTPTVPGPDSSDVLVRITHVAHEYGVGIMFPILPVVPFTPAMIPEVVFSGTVIAAGGVVPEALRSPGTRVVGAVTPFSMVMQGGGALKEYIRLSSDQVVKLPETGTTAHPISLIEAVAIASGATPAFAMVRAANVKAGQRVLINGASGSSGQSAVQICRDRGAIIVGIASGRNEALVRECGASEVCASIAGYCLPTKALRCLSVCIG